MKKFGIYRLYNPFNNLQTHLKNKIKEKSGLFDSIEPPSSLNKETNPESIPHPNRKPKNKDNISRLMQYNGG